MSGVSVDAETGVVYMTDVRLSFPHLIKPRPNNLNPNAPMKYEAEFIVSPEQLEVFRGQMWKLAQMKWTEHAAAVFQGAEADRKMRCYGDATEKLDKNYERLKGYMDGTKYVNAKNIDRPKIYKADGSEVPEDNMMEIQEALKKLYGGAYVKVALKPYLQDNGAGRGLRCDLLGIQFLRDGESFGTQAPDVSGGFGAIPGAPAPVDAGAAAAVGMGGAPATQAPPVAPGGAPGGIPGGAPVTQAPPVAPPSAAPEVSGNDIPFN